MLLQIGRIVDAIKVPTKPLKITISTYRLLFDKNVKEGKVEKDEYRAFSSQELNSIIKFGNFPKIEPNLTLARSSLCPKNRR